MILDSKNILTPIKYTSVISLIMYTMQGTLYPASSFLGKIFLAIYLAIGIFCLTSLLLSSTRQSVIYTSTAFIIANLAYFGFSDTSPISAFYSIDMHSPIKNTVFVLFTLYTSFYLTQKKALDRKLLLIIYALIFASGLINFFSLSPFSKASATPVNNTGYIFANLLPFLFLIKRKTLSLMVLALSAILVVLSLKRGAILITVAIAIYYIYILFKESNLSSKHKATILVMLFIMFVTISSALYYNDTMLQERVDQTLSGNSSGRNYLYGRLWENWKNTESIGNILFGYGMSHTVLVTGGRYAHNDWLELITNMGLLGIGLYFLFFMSIIKNAADSRMDMTDRRIIISIIIILLIKSVLSMGYTDQGSMPLMLMLGYALGNKEKQFIDSCQ